MSWQSWAKARAKICKKCYVHIYYKGVFLCIIVCINIYIYMIDLSWCKLEDSNPLFSPDASQAFIGFHKFVSFFCTRSCIVLSRCASPKDLDMSLHRRVSRPLSSFDILCHPLACITDDHWCLSAWPCPAHLSHHEDSHGRRPLLIAASSIDVFSSVFHKFHRLESQSYCFFRCPISGKMWPWVCWWDFSRILVGFQLMDFTFQCFWVFFMLVCGW